MKISWALLPLLAVMLGCSALPADDGPTTGALPAELVGRLTLMVLRPTAGSGDIAGRRTLGP